MTYLWYFFILTGGAMGLYLTCGILYMTINHRWYGIGSITFQGWLMWFASCSLTIFSLHQAGYLG